MNSISFDTDQNTIIVTFDSFVMKSCMCAALAFFVSAVMSPASPRLVVSTPSLVPESAIDLVLDLPAVAAGDLGKEMKNDWFVVEPDLPGKLRWKAPNVAEFIPARCPEIGASYEFSMMEGKKHLDGSAVPAGKLAKLAAEDFRSLSVKCPTLWQADFSPSTAELVLAFNDEVDPKAVVAHVSFVPVNGPSVAAKVERPTKLMDDFFAGIDTRIWKARWSERVGEKLDDAGEFLNVVVVRPEMPLRHDKNWRLVISEGLPNASGTAICETGRDYAIGEILPFEIRKIKGETIANEGRKIAIEFTHRIPQGFAPETLATKLSINPPPTGFMRFKVDGQTLYISGDFSLADKYDVSFSGPFESNDGLPLVSGNSALVTFSHLEPSLALPSTNEAQLAAGFRNYHMETVNLASLRVRMKQLRGVDLIRTYQGYRRYTGVGHDAARISPTALLPWDMVVGETVAEREIVLGNPIDSSKQVTLDWNEWLPKSSDGSTYFLDVVGVQHPKITDPAKRGAQAIIQLTDIGLAWKFTGKESLIYAFSCETGAPMPGVQFELFGEDAASMGKALTNDQGLATIERNDGLRHLLATRGADSFVTVFDSTIDTVGMWNFPVRYQWGKPPEMSRKVMLLTDRSLYRPGETVRLKGIIRSLRGNAIGMDALPPARLVLLDPESREILNEPITISANGSFDFSHKLAPSTVGEHQIRLEFPDELRAAEELKAKEGDWYEIESMFNNARHAIALQVQEFRRNAFEITQSIAKPETGAKSVTAELAAKTYQGQAVAIGTVRHFSRVSPVNLYPERFRDFLFGNHRDEDGAYWYHYFGEQGRSDESSNAGAVQMQGDAKLASDGTARIEVEIPQSEFPSAHEVTISSDVTDANHQTLNSVASVTVHPASVYVGISRVDQLVRINEELPLKIVAIAADERPFADALKLTATLKREVNSAVKTRTNSGEIATRNEATEELVSISELTLDPNASLRDGQLFGVTPASPGRHFLTLRGTDPQGRAFATVVQFHVYGSDDFPWKYEEGIRVKMLAEKKSYQPGETARVLVLSPIEGTALVTVEREKVLRSFFTQLKADQPVIEVPLGDEDAPNVYVSVLIVKGSKESARKFPEPQLRLGYCELTVENRRDRLKVEIDKLATDPRPGDDVTLTGSALLPDGKPAVGAEVTLYAEDEGTLAVMGYETPRPMDFFYDPRILSVSAGTSFESFIPEDIESQYFHNKGFFVGGGADAAAFAELWRKNFDPCATWAPALVTDAAGKFHHAFKLPDTLTRYRLIAVVHQGGASFGHGESSMVVKKDLMIEPKVPRFANQSDAISPQIQVVNASRFSGTWRIEFNAHAADGTPVCRVQGNDIEIVSLTPGASATLVFPVLAENTGEAVMTWKATPVSLANGALSADLTRQLSDAVESRFPVKYPAPLLRQVKILSLDKPGVSSDLAALIDPAMRGGIGKVEVSLSRSPLSAAADSVDFLLKYPYGCVEQSTSAMIPWCIAGDLKAHIPALAKASEAECRAAIQIGVDRLLSMQLPNGSFAYWPGDNTTAEWATPYAGLGLLMAADAGAGVPPSTIDAMCRYLMESLRGMAQTRSASELELHARSLFVLAYAKKAQVAYQNVLAGRANELSAEARALLAAAIARSSSNDKDALAVARSLLAPGKSTTTDDEGDWMSCSPDMALKLLAWTQIDPRGNEALSSLDRLLNERSPYGHWRTTWVNGWSLIAMGQFAKHQEKTAATTSLMIESNEGSETLKIDSETPTLTRAFDLGTDMKISATAESSAFVRLSVTSKPAITPVKPLARNGLSIDRLMYRVNPDGSMDVLQEPTVGDLIRVTLRVTLPHDGTRYLVIDDPLPAVFESVNTDFASQSSGNSAASAENDWHVSHSEMRGDRTVFFLDHIPKKGTYTVSYLVRCTLAGEAIAPPAKVESMYDPENFALSASRGFTVE